MNQHEIFHKVSESMVEMFHLESKNVTLEARLVEDLDLDSIDAIDMAVRIEEKTGLALSGEDLHSIQTIQDAVDLIHVRL